MHVLVAGAGWLGSAIARALVGRGDRVTAVRRSAAPLRELEELGAATLALDLSAPGAPDRLPGDLDAVVACQSARGDSPGAYRAAYVDVNRALLEVAASRTGCRFVYTGSTGVFGQRDGGDVDEATAPQPSSATAAVLVDAERLVGEAASAGTRANVLRLSGLYDPGRFGVVERVRSGALGLGPGDDAWMNFCHLHDAVTFVLATLDRGRPGAVYHGSDAAPASRADVARWIAGRLGIAPATGVNAAGGPNRRVRSERTRGDLAVELRYPSFREGLAGAIVPPG